MSKFAAFRKTKPDAKNYSGKDNVYDRLDDTSPNPYNRSEKMIDTIRKESGATVDLRLLKGGLISVTAASLVDFYLAKSILVHKFHYNQVNVFREVL